MKALILSAGLGTRLRPYTEHTPKPLFPIGDKPALAHIIDRLVEGGCTEAAINTHHLHRRIESYIAAQHYPIRVSICYEPSILGTGGAIKNLEDFWDQYPFMVVNSDIVTDIDFGDVYRLHCTHDHLVTLVLKDHPAVNTVSVDGNRYVTGFGPAGNSISNQLTFTGIQVLDPAVLGLIPQNRYFHSVDLYEELLGRGHKIVAYIANDKKWTDIGTIPDYRNAALAALTPKAFEAAFSKNLLGTVHKERLSGDGSDRRWYRVQSGHQSLILADHGIHGPADREEVDAFIDIGRFLHGQQVPVPKIHAQNRFAGLVFLDDLGNVHLQDVVLAAGHKKKVIHIYRRIIDGIISFWLSAAKGFDTGWTYQSEAYDQTLILEKECRYFMEAFVSDYSGLEFHYDHLEEEFEQLADGAIQHAMIGLMHRDMQSRNIMLSGEDFFFIDFQGARLGPLQYDIASLLIDPYVALPAWAREVLLAHGNDRLKARGVDVPDRFFQGYRYCAVCRNLQILGAFGYLSRVKRKPYFENYIPQAVETLEQNLAAFGAAAFPRLRSLVGRISEKSP